MTITITTPPGFRVPLVALWGNASSGKNEVARLLALRASARGGRAECVALADPFKRFARDLYGIPASRLWGSSEQRLRPLENLQTTSRYLPGEGEVSHPNARDIMQLFNHLREADPDVYLHKLLDTCRQLDRNARSVIYDPQQGMVWPACELPPLTLLVCTDARQQNEVLGLRAWGAKIIRVRDVNPQAPEAAWQQHPSEKDPRELPDTLADEVLVNDHAAGYAALMTCVEALYDRLCAG